MDPATGLAILGSAIGGKQIIEKILGPTAEYVGVGLRDWTARRVENVKRIFAAAKSSLGEDIESPGAVPPKVLKEVLEEGSFNDDPLACEYFGGVLASSRSPVSRDDRGAAHMKLVADLTTYQIRTHYLFYLATKKVFDGSPYSLAVEEHRRACGMFISLSAYGGAMDFSKEEDFAAILAHATFGLYQHGLIGNFNFGGLEDMRKRYPNLTKAGIEFQPTARGVELFMWACGLGGRRPEAFLDVTVKIPEKAQIKFSDGFSSLKEANKTPEPTPPFVTPRASEGSPKWSRRKGSCQESGQNRF